MQKRPFALKALLSALTALLLLSSSGCSSLADRLFGPAWTWPSLETGDQRTVTTREQDATSVRASDPAAAATTAPPSSRSSETTAATSVPDRTIDFNRSTPDFDEQVRALLQEGLDSRMRSISLDPVFSYWHVRESQVQEAIDRIYALFSDIYHRQPRFFYLNGSFQIFYSVLRGGENEIAGLRVEPSYWPSTSQLNETELDEMVDAVLAIVGDLAVQIQAETDKPHEQLALLQEWLVRHIRYDETGDQSTNHAGSALLDQVTLCQGYAQAFQLAGQALGLDVRLITGSADGIGHAWNQVVLDGIAYHVDVTHDDPTPDAGAERPVRHVHLFRSDDVFAESHQWDRTLYLPCPHDGAFYYHQHGLVASDRSSLKRLIRQFCSDLDIRSGQYYQLELLYTGPDQPDRDEIEALFVTELQRQAGGVSVYYRTDILKQVVIVQVSSKR